MLRNRSHRSLPWRYRAPVSCASWPFSALVASGAKSILGLGWTFWEGQVLAYPPAALDPDLTW